MEQGQHDRPSSQHQHQPGTSGGSRDRDRRPGKDRKYDDDPYRGSQRPGRRSYGDDESSSRRRHRDEGSRYERSSRDDRSRDERPRDRSRHRDEYRDRHYDRPRDSYRNDEPSRIVLLRNLSPHVTNEMIRSELEAIQFFPVDIRRIARDHEQKIFAFIEFSNEAGGVAFMAATGGHLKLGGDWCSLHYSVPREGRTEMFSDWTCPVCQYLNFGRRKFCQKCGTSQDGIKAFPSEAVLLKNLDVIVTEECVLSLIGQLTSLPIKSLKIAKDPLLNVSLGYCLVEMNSTKEAIQLHDLLVSMGDDFKINEKPVKVTYYRKPLASQNESVKAKASLALSAAQWTNQSLSPAAPYPSYYGQESQASYGANVLPDLGTVNVGGTIYKRYPFPNPSSFQFDQTSGFRYDPQTGFYYDPKSSYYFNSATQQYMYWEGTYQTYIPVPSAAQTATTAATTNTTTTTSSAATITAAPTVEVAAAPKPPSPPPEGSEADAKGKKKDKSKLLEAKKINKDMERWARMQDKKRDMARQSQQNMQAQTARPSAEDVGYLVLEKEASKHLKDAVLGQPKRNEILSSSLAFLADYGEDDNTDTVDDDLDDASKIEEDLAKLIDWDKLSCLLCKRKFSSKEILSKHEKQSDLHLKNLEVLRATKMPQGSGRQAQVFRDRARERREKYGHPDVPLPSLMPIHKRKPEEESISYEEPTKFGIGSDNVGNKLLKAMGWNEGQGLGKDNQGATEILGVSQRSGSTGLGAPNSGPTATTPFDYRKYGKKLMHARYYELP